jgi:hypothetical protein
VLDTIGVSDLSSALCGRLFFFVMVRFVLRWLHTRAGQLGKKLKKRVVLLGEFLFLKVLTMLRIGLFFVASVFLYYKFLREFLLFDDLLVFGNIRMLLVRHTPCFPRLIIKGVQILGNRFFTIL